MSKPIFIARIPKHTANIDSLLESCRGVATQLYDYHFIPVIDGSVDRVEFECYNAPHTEIEFEELKKKVLEILNLQ